MTETQNYTRTAVILHWLVGVCVLAQITLGLWMITIPKAPPGVRAGWFNVHKSIGITLAAFIILRLLWRWAHRAPPLPASVPPWERAAARANHILLYVCMIVMPLSGYLGSSFTKYPILYWGIKLPQWGWDAPDLKELSSQVHWITATIFIALIALHVAAAIKHWLVDRDGVVRRMWFTRATE
ncbi:MAG: cytochrome [Betaproteobacteria bacterium]|jgi:cytochrome b561|nr:cytochrome [Betaproteobacteria bacterium]